MNIIGSSVAGATATTLALGALLASAPVASAATAPTTAPALTAARSNVVTRTVDLDGDRRSDRLTVSLFNVRSTYKTFMVSVKTRTGTARMPLKVSNENNGFTASDLLVGTADFDGLRGNEILLDESAGVGDFAYLRTYKVSGDKLVHTLAPTGDEWRALYPPYGNDSYAFATRAGKRYVTHTALQRSASGRYYGKATTYVYSNGWKVDSTKSVSGLRLRDVDRIPLWSGLTVR